MQNCTGDSFLLDMRGLTSIALHFTANRKIMMQEIATNTGRTSIPVTPRSMIKKTAKMRLARKRITATIRQKRLARTLSSQYAEITSRTNSKTNSKRSSIAMLAPNAAPDAVLFVRQLKELRQLLLGCCDATAILTNEIATRFLRNSVSNRTRGRN